MAGLKKLFVLRLEEIPPDEICRFSLRVLRKRVVGLPEIIESKHSVFGFNVVDYALPMSVIVKF